MKNTWSKRVISIDPKDIKYDRDGQVDVKWLRKIDPSGVIDPDRLPTQKELMEWKNRKNSEKN